MQLAENSTSSCADFLDTLAGVAFRFCGGNYVGGALWSDTFDANLCAAVTSNITSQLCKAATGSSNSTIEVSALVLSITSMPETLTAADISATSFIVESLTTEAIVNPEVRDKYLEIIDNIQQADPEDVLHSQSVTKSSQKILDNLATFSDELNLTSSNVSSDGKAVFSLDTFALQLQDIDPDFFNGQTFSVNLGSVGDAMELKGDIENSLAVVKILHNSTASVQLPDNFLDAVQGCTGDDMPIDLRLSYSVFLTDILFQSHYNQNQSDIGSIVVATRLGCADNSSLLNPIQVSFRTVEEINDTNVKNGGCAIWDPEADKFGAWSSSGCREVTDGGNHTVCECRQLGHFGILFDLNPEGPVDPAVSLALFIITYIGIGVSLLCLALLICTYLCSKKLRSDTHTQIILNMGLSLAGLYIFFLIGGHMTGIPVLCGFSAAFLHYFMLVFFSWTAVEAIWLYIKLVKVFGTQAVESLYMVKAGVPAWAIPFLIVTLSAGPGHKYYLSNYYCRATEWPFWFGFLLPFALLYTFDWIMFIIIIISVTKQRRESSKMNEYQTSSNFKVHRENLIIALSLAVVFGLGWGLGLIATSYPVEEITVTLQVLFSVFVGAQGALLFLLHGIRNADARRVWKKWAASFSSATRLTLVATSSSHKNSTGKAQVAANLSKNCSGSTSLGALPQKLDLSHSESAVTSETKMETSETKMDLGESEPRK